MLTKPRCVDEDGTSSSSSASENTLRSTSSGSQSDRPHVTNRVVGKATKWIESRRRKQDVTRFLDQKSSQKHPQRIIRDITDRKLRRLTELVHQARFLLDSEQVERWRPWPELEKVLGQLGQAYWPEFATAGQGPILPIMCQSSCQCLPRSDQADDVLPPSVRLHRDLDDFCSHLKRTSEWRSQLSKDEHKQFVRLCTVWRRSKTSNLWTIVCDAVWRAPLNDMPESCMLDLTSDRNVLHRRSDGWPRCLASMEAAMTDSTIHDFTLAGGPLSLTLKRLAQARKWYDHFPSSDSTTSAKRDCSGFESVNALDLASFKVSGGWTLELAKLFPAVQEVLLPPKMDPLMPPVMAMFACLKRIGPLPTTRRHMSNIAALRDITKSKYDSLKPSTTFKMVVPTLVQSCAKRIRSAMADYDLTALPPFLETSIETAYDCVSCGHTLLDRSPLYIHEEPVHFFLFNSKGWGKIAGYIGGHGFFFCIICLQSHLFPNGTCRCPLCASNPARWEIER